MHAIMRLFIVNIASGLCFAGIIRSSWYAVNAIVKRFLWFFRKSLDCSAACVYNRNEYIWNAATFVAVPMYAYAYPCSGKRFEGLPTVVRTDEAICPDCGSKAVRTWNGRCSLGGKCFAGCRK